MHTKLADVDDTRPPERFTLQSTARARRRSPRRTTPFRTRKWPCGHGTAPLAPQQVQARIRTRHWLSQEDDALVYAREVHMDCSRPAATMPVLTSTMVSESTRVWQTTRLNA